MSWFSRFFGGGTADREAALTFLAVLQWATARQQQSLEEWNDCLAGHEAESGDELFSPSIALLDDGTADQLLPVAERRLTTARRIRDEFAKLQTLEAPGEVTSAIEAWLHAFDLHLKRAEIAVDNGRPETRRSDWGVSDERHLVAEESVAANNAVLAQRAVMARYRVDFEELQVLMFEACNTLRVELGKRPLSKEEYADLYSQGMAGRRARFYA